MDRQAVRHWGATCLPRINRDCVPDNVIMFWGRLGGTAGAAAGRMIHPSIHSPAGKRGVVGQVRAGAWVDACDCSELFYERLGVICRFCG